MATAKKSTSRSGAAKTAAKTPARTTSTTSTTTSSARSTESGSTSGASSSGPKGEAKRAVEQEQAQGKTVTSVSAGPLAVPTAEVAGAGADRAAATAVLREKDGVVVNGTGLTNQEAELDGSMSVDDFLTKAAIGTTISKTGRGIQVTSPVGGGQNRVFAGQTFADAKAEMDEFFAGSPRLLKPITKEGRERAEAERDEDEGEDSER